MAEKDVQVLNEILARINGEEPTTPGGGKPSGKSEGTGADDTKYSINRIQSNKDENIVRDNVRSGLAALRKLADGEDSVKNAMYRPELSDLGGTAEITLDWGTQGKINKEGIYRGGSGILKIIDKHGIEEAIEDVNTIARGTIGISYGPELGKRVNITNNERTAVVSLYRNSVSERWVVTGYKNESKTDAKGRGSDLNSATLSDPIRTRAELVAALDSLVDNELSSGKGTTSSATDQTNDTKKSLKRDEEYAKAVESGDVEKQNEFVKAAAKERDERGNKTEDSALLGNEDQITFSDVISRTKINDTFSSNGETIEGLESILKRESQSNGLHQSKERTHRISAITQEIRERKRRAAEIRQELGAKPNGEVQQREVERYFHKLRSKQIKIHFTDILKNISGQAECSQLLGLKQ